MIVHGIKVFDPDLAAQLQADPSLVTRWRRLIEDGVLYPDSDNVPRCENTIQGDWMRMLAIELKMRFAGETAFVAGNLFWYPVRGRADIRYAPDVMVAFGRPTRQKFWYRQWHEQDVAPQVVFEVLSQNDTAQTMEERRVWYERYGVEEFYVINPDVPLDEEGEFLMDAQGNLVDYPTTLRVFLKTGTGLEERDFHGEHASPRLGIRFVQDGNNLNLYFADRVKLEVPEAKVTRLAAERMAAEQAMRTAMQQQRAASRARGEAIIARKAVEQELKDELAKTEAARTNAPRRRPRPQRLRPLTVVTRPTPPCGAPTPSPRL